jgi:drug/metabolite transporter (DMT)-like permease
VTASPAARPRSPRAVIALLAVTIVWGWSFIWIKTSLTAAERVLGHPGGPPVVSLYVAVRFGIAALVLALWPRARTGLDRGAWRAGGILGGLLFSGFLFQMIGLEHVSPPVSAFLTSLYVVFAAILTSWQHRTRPHFPFLIGVLLATFGAGFIEGPPQLTYGLGEWLTVASAFIFALHILMTDRLTKEHASLAVTLAMFVVTAGAAVVSLGVCSTRAAAPAMAEMLTLLHTRDFIVPLLLSTFLGTVIALTLINVFQKAMDPVRAAILYALEPIWTTVIAAMLGFGLPGFWLWIGGGALLAGNVIAELGVEE